MIRSAFCILVCVLSLNVFVLVRAQSSCAAGSCGLDQSAIASYPSPQVVPLAVDEALLHDREYRQVSAELKIYDQPAGEIIDTLGAGYSFVTVQEELDGWAHVGDGKWVLSDSLGEPWTPSRFAGVLLPNQGLPYTMAWTLRHLNGATSPGGPEAASNPFLYRYSRVNIYSTVEVDGYNWYQIGADQWVHQFKVAKLLPVEKPLEVDTHKWVSVDLYEQVAIAYEGDKPVFATLISSGLEEWPTNEGIFHVYVRFPRTLMSGAYNQPDFYYLQEVPWTMYFDGDIALHGAYWHDGFGYRKSHGCVNMTITDAHWLFQWAEDEYDFANGDYTGPAVYVYSSGDYN